MTRYFIAGGPPLTDFGTVFRREFLPYAFGFSAPGAVAAGLLLASAGSRSPRGALAAAASAPGPPPVRLPAPQRCSTRSSGRAVLAPALALSSRGAAGRRSSRPRWRSLLGLGGARALPLRAGNPSRLAHGSGPTSTSSASSRGAAAYSSTSRSPASSAWRLRYRPAAAFFGWLLLTAILFTLGRELTLARADGRSSPATRRTRC